MKQSLVITLLLCTFVCRAQGNTANNVDSHDTASSAGRMSFSGCYGGMMLHSGYVSSKAFDYVAPDGSKVADGKMSGAPFGIGGAVKAGFGRHLRVGAEGYVSTLYYDRNHSYSTTGWGGILLESKWEKGRWLWFVGGTVGGGTVKNVMQFSEQKQDLVIYEGAAKYRRYGFMTITPFIGVEYALKERVHLTLKLDWMTDITSRQPDFLNGPRIYFGFMFFHSGKRQ